MPSRFKCCVKDCQGGEKIFRFPKKYKEEWCAILKMDPEELRDTHRVCELHFDASVIGTKRPMKGAVPTQKLGDNYDPIHLEEAGSSTEALKVPNTLDHEENSALDSSSEMYSVLNGEDRQSRINDLQQQEQLILMLEERSPETLSEEQRRKLFIRDQKARVLRQLRELGAESLLLQQFLASSTNRNK